MENESPVLKRANKRTTLLLGKSGKIVVWTKIFVAPSKFEDDVPYYVAIVLFADGKKLPLQLVDVDKEPKKNQKIVCVARRIGKPTPSGVIQYGIKAKAQ